MKKLISLSILTAIFSLLSACGVRGALYFPVENSQPTEQTQNYSQH